MEIHIYASSFEKMAHKMKTAGNKKKMTGPDCVI